MVPPPPPALARAPVRIPRPGPRELLEWQGTGAVVYGPSGSWRKPPHPLVCIITLPHARPSKQ